MPTNERVLVVDDDRAVRDTFAAILERAGFEVVTAANGVEAAEVIASLKCQVITCDLQMPILGGAALYARVLATRPDVAEKFIFATSRPDVPRQAFLSKTGRPVLWKPVSLADLTRTVREVADSRSSVGQPPVAKP